MSDCNSPLDAPDRRRLPPLLRKAWYGLKPGVLRRRIKRHGATPGSNSRVLRLLRVEKGSAEGLSQRDLCELMSSDPNTMAALLSRMEEQGLVERRPDPRDKRTRRVTATAHGKTLFKKLRATALTLQGDILNAIPEERREQFSFGFGYRRRSVPAIGGCDVTGGFFYRAEDAEVRVRTNNEEERNRIIRAFVLNPSPSVFPLRASASSRG